MRIHIDTTLQKLLEGGRISQRTYNCLRYAGMLTLEDVINYGESTMDLMRVQNFGRKSLTELEPLLSEAMEEDETSSQYTKENMLGMLDETLCTIMRDAYEALFAEDNDVTRYFKDTYPSAAELHSAVMRDVDELVRVRAQFSIPENIGIRKLFAKYLDTATTSMQNQQATDNDTYRIYKNNLSELLGRMERFGYNDKANYFMSERMRQYMNMTFNNMYPKENVRTRHFLDRFAPNFEVLLPYFEAPMTEYRKLYQRQGMKHTLAEVFKFNQQLKAEFDKCWLLTDKDMRMALLMDKFPFLNYAELDFVGEYSDANGNYPLFFILHRYMLTSPDKSNRIFGLYHGIIDGKKHTMAELAETMKLTRERIRQILSKPLDAHTKIIKNKGWKKYDALLSLPYVTEKTREYRRLAKNEHLDFGFETFAHLMMLLGDNDFEVDVTMSDGDTKTQKFIFQYEAETVGETTVVINRRMLPSLNIHDCTESLQQAISSRHTNDTSIGISTFLNPMAESEKEFATMLMAYVAKKGLKQDVNDRYDLLIHKNHIDVADDLYSILAEKGEPMSADEIYDAFKKMYPTHKYTDSAQIRPWLFRHPNIKAIGNSSRYGLDTWTNIFYGSMRDLLIMQLDNSDEPLHIDVLFNGVSEHYPDTTPGSLEMSMRVDDLNRFVAFNDNLYGLRAKHYDESYKECEQRQRSSFFERLEYFRTFVETNKRYPITGNRDEEASLYRWLYNIQNNVYEVKEEYKAKLAEVLALYEQQLIPRNATENEFRNNCEKYKAYIENHNVMPSASREPELHKWMTRSKARYNNYSDYRKKYMKNLLDYIESVKCQEGSLF